MAMTKELSVQDRTYSIEQYLALEEVADAKHEYRNGKIIERNGLTFEHITIVIHLLTTLNIFLREKTNYAAIESMKVGVLDGSSIFYPDATILCGKPEFFNGRQDVVVNPCLLVEVLSKSTEAYDRGKKFELYATLPSLREYVLVSQYEPKIETYYRPSAEQDTWEYRKVAGPENEITLQALDCTVRLADVYHSIDFEKISDEEETVKK